MKIIIYLFAFILLLSSAYAITNLTYSTTYDINSTIGGVDVTSISYAFFENPTYNDLRLLYIRTSSTIEFKLLQENLSLLAEINYNYPKSVYNTILRVGNNVLSLSDGNAIVNKELSLDLTGLPPYIYNGDRLYSEWGTPLYINDYVILGNEYSKIFDKDTIRDQPNRIGILGIHNTTGKLFMTLFDVEITQIQAGNSRARFFNVYEIFFDEIIPNTNSIYYSSNDENFIYIKENKTIYKYNYVGDLIDTLYINTGSSETQYKDILSYDNKMFVLNNFSKSLNEFTYPSNYFDTTQTTFVVNGQSYDRSLCSNSDELCTNMSYFISYGQVNFECLSTKTFCSGGCVNQTTTDNVIYGVCSQLPCNNECDNLNNNICTTLNTYSQCVRGLDGCTDLLNDFYCPANYYCSDGQCDQVSINTSGLWTQEAFFVKGNVTPTNAYEQTKTDAERYIKIISTPISLNVIPDTITQLFLKTLYKQITTEVKTYNIGSIDEYYYGTSCDFTNNILEFDDLQHNNLASNGWNTNASITTLNSIRYIEINTTETTTKELKNTLLSQEIELMFKPYDNAKTILTFTDNNNVINGVTIEYSNTNKTLSIYENTYNKTFVEDVSLSITDDLERIVLVAKPLKDLKSISYEILIIRKPNNVEVINRVYTLPIGYENNLAITPDTISIQTTDRIDLYHVLQREQDGFPSYSLQTESITPTQCNYFALGCRNVRVFGNINNIPTYHFYDDIEVCATKIGELINNEISIDEAEAYENTLGGLTENFSTKTKLLIALIVTACIFLLFLFLSASLHDKSIVIVGTILSILSLIYFSVIAFIPFWSIIIMSILSAGVFSIWAKNQVMN